jgi:prepilin-type N-terminal cleavage/methylation domain-containing protein
MNKLNNNGFTIIESVVSIIVISIMIIGISDSYKMILSAYSVSRQLNEVYTVLSACPEIDRSLDFSALNQNSSCSPNDSFSAENNGGHTITYNPTLLVSNTSSLSVGDPLRDIPDSKVIEVSTPLKTNSNVVKVKLLITRNGIGQQ